MDFQRMDVLGVPIDPSWLITNEGRDMKVEITVNDLCGHEAIVLSTHENDGNVFVCIPRDGQGDYHVEVDIDDLKAALRKLSAK